MKQKLLLLCMALLVSVCASAYDFESEGIYYNKNTDGTSVAVTFKDLNYNSYSGAVNVPTTVSYDGAIYSVTSIGSHAFYGCTGLTELIIPNSVTTIEQLAFRDCRGLTSLTIPNTVTSIGDMAFIGCSGLTEVIIPNSVTEIGHWTFEGCTGLISVTLGNSVTTIGEYAFYQCSNLAEVTIPNSVTSIGKLAFVGCKNLTAFYGKYASADNRCLIVDGVLNSFAPKDVTTYDIPNTVTTIGDNAFYNCTELTSVTIPNTVTAIAWQAFCNCRKLAELTIPGSVTSIGYQVFIDTALYNNASNWEDNVLYIGNNLIEARNLSGEYTIKEGTVVIADRAFWGCYDLTSVIIPGSVTSISENAFYACSNLTSVTFSDSVTSIGDNAFCGCSSLTSVTIPGSVTSIGANAFQGCSGLIEVIIPNSVTSIGSSAFYGCTGLTSVTIGNSVTSIEQYTFYGCTGLASVAIPTSVTLIDKSAFYGCSGIKTLRIEDGEATLNFYSSDRNYYPFNNCKIENLYLGRNLSSWVALCNTSSLKTVEFGNSVTSIGWCAFYGCTGLTSVTIPNSVTSIDEYVFYDCSGLTSLSIGNSVATIGGCAFYGCTGLTSLTIPNSVTTISPSAFSGCSSMKSLYIEDGETNLSLYSSYTNGYPFKNCEIENLYVGRNLSSWQPLCNSTALTQVEFGTFVTSIGSRAFYGCTGLTSLTIPSSVSVIGNLAFCGCTELATIIELSVNPPTCFSYTFLNVDKETCKLYVPYQSVEDYKDAAVWKEFYNIEGIKVSGIDVNQAENDNNLYKVYDLNGILRMVTEDESALQNLPAGIYIINGKKVRIR